MKNDARYMEQNDNRKVNALMEREGCEGLTELALRLLADYRRVRAMLADVAHEEFHGCEIQDDGVLTPREIQIKSTLSDCPKR